MVHLQVAASKGEPTVREADPAPGKPGIRRVSAATSLPHQPIRWVKETTR